MRRGTRVGQAYVAITADGSDLNAQITDEVDNATDGVGDSGNEAGRRYGDNFTSRFRERLDGMRSNIGDRLEQRLAEAGRVAGASAGDEAGRSMTDRLSSSLNDDFADRLAGSFADRLSDTLGDRLELMLASASDDLADRLDEMVSRNRRSPSPREADSDPLGDRIGSILGAGSRNNFLNLFGRTLGNTINLTETLAKSAKGLFSTFQTGFNQFDEGTGILTRLGGGLSGVGGSLVSGLSGLAASGPAAALAIGLVTVAMSVMVSVASALLALLVAISSTLVSALVGAAAVGAGALGAVAVAGGLVAVAFTSMTDAQKEALKADFAPLKQELTGLGQLMLTELIPYFGTWANNLQTALYQLAPLASVFGDAIGRAGATITASLAGPGFALLTQQLGVYLPSIVTRLSTALGGFLNGSAGIFAALLPSVNRFAGYLADVADRFSRFATSAQGQNQIADFIDRAINSLISFKGFIQEALGFLGDLLFSTQAQGAGNSIFDSLRDSFAGFREDLQGDDLKHWFERALEFGSDVKDLIISIKDVIKRLDEDGTLSAVGKAFEAIAFVLQLVVTQATNAKNLISSIFTAVTNPGQLGTTVFDLLGFKVDDLNNKITGTIRNANLLSAGAFGAKVAAENATGPVEGPGIDANGNTTIPSVPTQQSIIDLGKKALEQTSVANGGYKPDPVKTPPKYVNPYVAYANSLIKDGPKTAAVMKNAILTVNKQVAAAINSASTSTDSSSVTNALENTVSSIKTSAKSTVNTARDSLNSAAQSLASATSASAAKKALKNVKASQKDLKAALANQKAINAAAALVNAQKVVSGNNVAALLAGIQLQNATLADYAEARNQLATKMDAANQKLADAISLRDDYNSQVRDSVNAFGSILSAQAATINGVQAALTAADITSNLQDRLKKIRDFQSNLNILLARGLSNDAYKQLVDGGVENGSAYVNALVQGGAGAVGEVNGLVTQINNAATALGGQASNRLYQAGVDAAQGLVDGLTSLSAQLDSAATALGNSIAAAVKRSLGIASPSRVMIENMGYVGDGIVEGLNRQHAKVGKSASALSGLVAVAPSLENRYAAGNVPASAMAGVQGGTTEHHWHITTPTTDPEAVAREAINEMTGRIG